jgi:FNIP Repeat
VEGGDCSINIPDSCRTVTFKHTAAPGALAPELPHGVTHVDLSESDITDQYSFSDLPDTVTKLQLPAEYTHHIGNLPTQLEYLDVGYKYNKALGVLPATLKQLYSKRKADDAQQYEHALDELPYSLEVVHVANMIFSVSVLPDTVERLHCTNHGHELGMLPASLKVLKIEGSNFNHPLGVLPDGLVELDLSTAVDFQQPLDLLPQSLQIVKLHSSYSPVHKHVLAAQPAPQHAVVAAVVAPAAAVVEAVIDGPVHVESTQSKWFKRAAAAVTAAAVTTAALYGVKLIVICYLLQSI